MFDFDPNLVAVVMALVELTKQLGAQGRPLILISTAIGLVLGVLNDLYGSSPIAFSFEVVLRGLALGLIASGVYALVTNVAKKVGGQDVTHTLPVEPNPFAEVKG